MNKLPSCSIIGIFIFACYLLTNCKQEHPNRVYFVNEGRYDKLATIIPFTVGEKDTMNIQFDTGAPMGCFMLDSTYCEMNQLPEWSGEADNSWLNHTSPWGSSEAGGVEIMYSWYKKPIEANVGNRFLKYDSFLKQALKNSLVDIDGVAGFPRNDTTHVWELNFDHNYLEIHQAKDFKMPANSYLTPLIIKEDAPCIQIPMFVKSANGDTITINDLYLIDTGLVQDLVLLPSSNEVNFFKEIKDNAVLVATMHGGYRSRFDVEAKIFDNFEMDSMRIYVDEHAAKMRFAGVIGLNFLKRFNVFFDLKTKQVGFQPVKQFKRIINPLSRKYYYSTNVTQDRKEFVREMADIPNNPYKIAGLEVGDEMIAINGFRLNKLKFGDSEKIEKSTIQQIDILRNGKPIKITVLLSKEYIEGE